MAGNFSNVLFGSIIQQPKSNRRNAFAYTLDCLSGKARMLKRRPEFSVSSNTTTSTTTTTTTTTTTLDPNSILQLINSGYEEFIHNNITYVLYSFSRDDDYLVIRTTQQILVDDDLHILVVGGGGSGAAATDESSNGGGGGGGVGDVKIITPSSDIYEIKFSVGKGGEPAGSEDNGEPGDSSIVNIYKNNSPVYSINSEGGGRGSTDSRGQGGLSDYSILQENLGAGYIFYRGGNGGDEDDGQSVTFLNSSYTDITNETLSNYSPMNILEHSSGGGGSKRQPPDTPGYLGGLGGGNQRLIPGTSQADANATNPYLGGYVGEAIPDSGVNPTQRENGSILEGYGYDDDVVNDGYFGGNGLFPGCGSGAGGCSLNRNSTTGVITIGTSFSSGRGADGIIKLCIKKSSAHKIVVGYKTEQGSTDNYYYWIFQTNKTLKYKALKNLSNFNVVCVGAGGGGGSSGHGVSNGGGGGGLTYGATISNMQVNNIVSFLSGKGGIGGEPGINNATIGNATVFENKTRAEIISAGGGHPGNTTAAGNGSSTFSHAYIGTQIRIINGALGGDQSAGFNSESFDLFPSEIDNVLTSLSIPHNFGGGGGGSKEDGDAHDYSGGFGAISNVGGARGIKGSGAGPGVPGLFGGGGGAGGFARDGDRHFGGNGGNGIIAMWVNKSNVT
jgi:hypothetical protein